MEIAIANLVFELSFNCLRGSYNTMDGSGGIIFLNSHDKHSTDILVLHHQCKLMMITCLKNYNKVNGLRANHYKRKRVTTPVPSMGVEVHVLSF